MTQFKKFFRFIHREDGTLKKKAIRSAFWLGLSTVGLALATFFRSIILARLLTPEIFGLMGLCIIIVRGLETFTRTGFAAALIQRQENYDVAKNTAFTLLILRGFVLAAITYLSAPLVASIYKRPDLVPLIQFVSLGFIFNGLININTVTKWRDLDFKRLAYLDQSVAYINLLIVITLAYHLRSVWALIIGNVAAAILRTIFSYTLIPGRPSFSFNWGIAKDLFSYGKFITGITIVLFVANEIDNAFIGKILGMDQLGFYVLAFMLANLPVTHLSRIISRVAFPAVSKIQDNKAVLHESYVGVISLLAYLSIPAAMGLIVLAPELIGTLYGERWMPAVRPLQVLCVYGGVRSINALHGNLFNAIGKPNLNFYLSLMRLILVLTLLYPLTARFSLVGSSIAVTVPMIIQCILMVALFCKEIEIKLRVAVMIIFRKFSISALMAVSVLFLKSVYNKNNLSSLALHVLMGVVVYLLLSGKEIVEFKNMIFEKV